MKENKISIIIHRPLSKVFNFTINPKNTPLWIDSIVEEKTNELPVKICTEYKNVNRQGEWTEYVVVAFEKDKIFELKQKDSYYRVRYTYEKISDNETKLIYFEWVENGELSSPFTLATLEKLKEVMGK